MAKSQITIARNELVDAAGRLRTAHPTTVFDFDLQYNKQTTFQWFEAVTGSATITHSPANSGVALNVTNASGDKATRTSMRHFRYQKGKGKLYKLTGVMAAAHANCVQRIGMHTANNGILFSMAGTTPTWTLRSDVSGSVVNRAVAQVDWNLDPMTSTNNRGNGVFDATKGQILVFDFTWLSQGRVKVGFEIDGKVVYVHEFRNANRIATAYMRTANLPITYEIENTGVTDGSKTMLQICGTVISEGGFDTEAGYTFPAFNTSAITGIGTTFVPLVSIRPRTTFNSITNRAFVELIDAQVTMSAAGIWGLFFNPTLTGASYNNVNTNNSTVEFDIAATAFSDVGIQIWGGLVGDSGTRSLSFKDLKTKVPFILDAAGSAAYTTISLGVRLQSGSGGSAFGLMNWREVY